MRLAEQLQSGLGTGYTVERELGGGGMSRVFLAEDHILGRSVVIKVLHPDLAAAVSVERFRREIMLAAKLQHPHLVPLLSAGETAGLPYFTMPYVQGESLRQRLLREGELSIPEALRVLREIAAALEYAHRNGIVHRDIKPDNVLLSSGSAMVTDFGVARAIRASGDTDVAPVTSAGIAVGTPAYMAPEQAAGDTALDHRADIYAFGVLAYEVLTGQPPFAGRSTRATFAAHVSEAPRPVAQSRPTTPPLLAGLIMRCLEKHAADRPQGAAEIVQALDAVGVNDSSIRPPSSSGLQPAWFAGRSHYARKFVLLAAVVVVAALAAAIPLRWSRRADSRATSPLRLGGTAQIRTVAVLPFVNTSGDSADEYLADGIADELTIALNKIPGVNVMARSSAFAFKGKGLSARAIGESLGVGAVLDGTVRRSGARVRVYAELVNVAGGLALWSQPYEPASTELFDLQDDVARAIARALRVRLQGDGRLVTGGTESAKAYDFYLRGRSSLAAQSEAELRRAVDMFQQAIAIDPSYARAWAGLAEAWTWLADDYVAPKSAYPRAREAAEHALAKDSTLAEAHAALGAVLTYADWNLAGADREMGRALELDSTYTTTHTFYYLLLRMLGQRDSAIAVLRRGYALDPYGVQLGAQVCVSRLEENRLAEAEVECGRAATYAPNDAALQSALLSLQGARGNVKEGLKALRRSDPTDNRAKLGAISLYISAGQLAEGKRELDRLVQEADTLYIRALSIAERYARLGEAAKTVIWLERAYDVGEGGLLLYLQERGPFARFDRDPAFVAFWRKVRMRLVASSKHR